MRENRKTLVGRIVSDKMDKTIVVEVETRKPHPLYHRIIKRTKRYKAHDETNQGNTGDLVRIVESRPISKEIRWQLAAVVEKRRMAEVQPEEIGAELERPGQGATS